MIKESEQTETPFKTALKIETGKKSNDTNLKLLYFMLQCLSQT